MVLYNSNGDRMNSIVIFILIILIIIIATIIDTKK